MLTSIQAEIEHNRRTLAPFIPIHRAWREALDRRNPADATGSAVELFFEARPQLPSEIKANVHRHLQAGANDDGGDDVGGGGGAGSLRQALAGDPRCGPVIAAQARALARACRAIATVRAESNAPCIHEL